MPREQLIEKLYRVIEHYVLSSKKFDNFQAADKQNIIQDTAFSLCGVQNLEAHPNPEALVKVLAIRRAVDTIDRSMRQITVGATNCDLLFEDGLAWDSDRQVVDGDVQKLTSSLSQTLRPVVEARLDGKRNSDIAAQLGITCVGVRSRLHRAIVKMRTTHRRLEGATRY